MSDFKNSGIFIAGSSVAATIALAVLIYKEVLLPTHTLSLQNEISALKADNASYKAKIEPLEQSSKSSKEQIGILLARVRELETTNIFTAGNSYPAGFGGVRIGQTAPDIEKAYPAAAIDKEKSDGFWSVKVDHALISSVTYYFAGEKKNIYQILFHMRSEGKTTAEQDAELLRTKITDALGPPTSNPKPGFYLWNVGKTKIYVRAYRAFLINEETTPPRDWPRS